MENSKPDILRLLQSSFLFRGLKIPQLQELAQKTRLLAYSANKTFIEEEVTNDKIFLILEGLVKIYKLTPEGKELFLAIDKANNFLGVMDLEDRPASATIQTMQPTWVLVFKKKDLRELLQVYPHLWERLYRIILAKLKEFNEFHSIRLGNSLYDRTYLLLNFLSRVSETITLSLSHEALAHIVGATRPRVTEVLHILRSEKKISMSPKKITILS